MASGIPELPLPPMNPLVLPEAGLNNGDNFRASFKNIQVFYADEFKIDHLKVDLDKTHIELTLTFPRLRIRSQYTIDGKILILQLQGQGPADGNFSKNYAPGSAIQHNCLKTQQMASINNILIINNKTTSISSFKFTKN